MPRRKNLDFIDDLPFTDQNNIPSSTSNLENLKKYYDTSVDPLYHTKPIGHDVLTTDIMK